MGQTEIALIDDIESVDVLAKKTTKRSMMNWVIWRVVRYFFHWKGQPVVLVFVYVLGLPRSWLHRQ
jgi:hypothetical protein